MKYNNLIYIVASLIILFAITKSIYTR